MALTKIDDRGLKTPIDLLDNEKIRLGTGNDLQLYHDGTDSHIYHSTAYPYNDLKIRSTADIRLQSNNTEDAVVCNVNGSVDLYYDNSKKFETTNTGATVTGSLGVGTTSPTNSLHLVASTTDILRVESTDAGDTGANILLYHNSASPADNDVVGVLNFRGKDDGGNETTYAEIRSTATDVTNGTEDGILTFHNRGSGSFGERMRIDSSGNVGIGTNSPSFGSGGGLHIRGADGGQSRLHITTSRSGDATGDGFYIIQQGAESGDDDTNFINYETANMKFSTSGTERMRIDASGHVLIGTTSTSGISSNADDIIIGSIGDSTARGLTFATTDAGSIRWADAGDNAMGRIQYANNTDVMTFHTSNATRMRLDSDGMKFGSDSAADNALDDYEEGTFTPLLGGSNYGSYNLTGTGKYTKVGRIVHFQIKFLNGDLDNNASGDMRIRGWPYSWSTTSARPVIPMLMMHNVTLPDDGNTNPSTYCLYGDSDGISMYGLHSHDGTDWDGWSVNSFESSGLYLDIAGSYMT